MLMLTAETLRIQERRIHRARRIAQHAERADQIARYHATARELLTPEDLRATDRILERNRIHTNRAYRGFDLSRKLFDLAEKVRRGLA
jgi:hypothetical protein